MASRSGPTSCGNDADGSNSQIVIYTTSDGKVNLEVQIDANTVWLTQQQIAQLYGKAVSTINEHLKNIFEDEELDSQVVSGYFDFAENRALDHIPTTMHDYRVMLDNILSAGGNAVLEGPGTISAAEARAKALDEYRKYQLRTLSLEFDGIKNSNNSLKNYKLVVI